MPDRTETSAGGVVYRRGESGVEIAVGEQRDRLTGRETLRLPKGGVHAGETLEQAALREVREETGLEARVVGELETVEYAYAEKGARVAKRVHFFLLEHVSGSPAPADGEMQRVYWCPLERVGESLSFDTERRVVAAARAALAPGAPGA